MSISSRSAVGVHVLALLAEAGEEPLSSETMAGSVNTNAVVIRRVLGPLRRAGLVRSQEGSGGGWRLARDPNRITLLDVYQAVEKEPLFSLHNQQPNPACQVGRNIQGALEGVFRDAETSMERRLERTTIDDVLSVVLTQVH